MITINIDTLTFEISNDGTVWDYLARSPINVLMISENNELNTSVVFEPTSNGSYICRLEVDMTDRINPYWHMLTYHAIQSVVGNYGHLKFLTNQHCAYRYIPAEGTADMIDGKVFKEPVLEGFWATLTDTESNGVDCTEGEPDVVEEEPRRPRDRPIREQMAKMGEHLDMLEKIHRHLMVVYATDRMEDIGIMFEYEGLNYLVNIVEGDEDLAAVMKYRDKTLVGIFLHDNIFVTKGHIRKNVLIDASGMSAYDFNTLMVNYSTLYEVQQSVSTRQRITRRERERERDRGVRRDSRERGNFLD